MARVLAAYRATRAEIVQPGPCWNGALENHAEVRIMFKTTDAAYAALERTIRGLHSYELPAIHAVHIDRISAPYMQWIADNSTGVAERG